MHKLSVLVVASAVLVGVSFIRPTDAEACGCPVPVGYGDPVVDLRTTAYRYGRAFAVFSGRVTASGDGRAVLDVQRMWKGPSGPTFTIQVGSRGPDGHFIWTSCDPSFKVGETYLVYAYGDSPAELRSHSCGGTRLLQYAAQEVLNLDYVVKQADDNASGMPDP
jgi:hypothetical protein